MTSDVATDTEKPTVSTMTEVQRDIVVTSPTVKMVDGKYRYFFDIQNNEPTPFTGTVNIKLLKANGTTLGDGDFGATSPIQPGMGDSVYIDINTGPVSVLGTETGVSQFKYEVTYSGQIIASGSEAIKAPVSMETY